MIRLIIIGITTFLLLTLNHDAFAAKKRVPRTGGKVVRGVGYSSARLSRPTNSVVVTFQNLGNVKKVSYEFSYTANGIPQGVVGSIAPAGSASETRDLYFGTCSAGVCTPHYNLKSAVLVVTTQLTSGATNVKRYRIKV